jgi:cell wall-associated NlpC family hydrolase
VTALSLGKSLKFTGTNGRVADLIDAVTDSTLMLSISEASSLTLTVRDPNKTLWRSGLLDGASWVEPAGVGVRFELASFTRDGAELELTFVDVIAARMQRVTGHLAFRIGTYRADFLRRLARDAQVPFLIEQGRNLGPSKTVLERASADDPTSESSWVATGRLADEVQWRRFSDGTHIVAGSDSWLSSLHPAVSVREGVGGVDQIDCDVDTGSGVSTATLHVWVAPWSVRPGWPVQVVNEGPASGLWLMESIQQPLTSERGTIILTRRQKQLDEVKVAGSTGDSGAEPLAPGEATTDKGGVKASSAGVEAMIDWAKRHLGNGYLYGSHGPDLWDCSSYVSAAIKAGGGDIRGTCSGLIAACRAHGTMLSSPAVGAKTRGALMFDIGGGAGASGNHVAISLGNGQTIQAHGRADGVVILNDATDRQWTASATVPGL